MTDSAAAQILPPPPPSDSGSNSMITQHSVFSRLPIMVKQELASLPPQKQAAFLEEFARKSKSTPIAYVFWLFGLHYAYLGRWGMWACYLFTGAGLIIWGLVDMFRMPAIVNDYNRDVAVQVMSQLKMVSS